MLASFFDALLWRIHSAHKERLRQRSLSQQIKRIKAHTRLLSSYSEQGKRQLWHDTLQLTKALSSPHLNTRISTLAQYELLKQELVSHCSVEHYSVLYNAIDAFNPYLEKSWKQFHHKESIINLKIDSYKTPFLPAQDYRESDRLFYIEP